MTREAYLEALGITVWARRGLEASRTPQAEAKPQSSPQPKMVPPATPNPTTNRVPVKPPEPATEPAATEPGAHHAHASKALGLSLGPGQGNCLFLCGSEDETASPLASDLARLPGAAPVWAKTAIAGKGVPLDTAVEERLFTAVVIFGQAQALLALGGAAPEQCGAARVVVVPELKRLAADPAARKSCWQAFKSLGLGRGQ